MLPIGAVTLMLPIDVDPKPYIREILRVDLESIAHPKTRECLEFGLSDARTDEDFSSLIESFHIFRSAVNAEQFFQSVESVQRRCEGRGEMNSSGALDEEDS